MDFRFGSSAWILIIRKYWNYWKTLPAHIRGDTVSWELLELSELLTLLTLLEFSISMKSWSYGNFSKPWTMDIIDILAYSLASSLRTSTCVLLNQRVLRGHSDCMEMVHTTSLNSAYISRMNLLILYEENRWQSFWWPNWATKCFLFRENKDNAKQVILEWFAFH
jgi:hypothetical protein